MKRATGIHDESRTRPERKPRAASRAAAQKGLNPLNRDCLAAGDRCVSRFDNFDRAQSIFTRGHRSAAFADGLREVGNQEQIIVFTPAELRSADLRIAV